MNIKYILGGVVLLVIVAGVIVWKVWFSKGSSAKPEVFAIATWDTAINTYSRKWATDYNTAKQRAATTVNLPLATYDQIVDAWNDGLENCVWGWIASNPTYDIVLASRGASECGIYKELTGQKTPVPSTNVGCIFVYGPKPKFDQYANDPKSSQYRGYIILDFSKSKGRWSRWDS